MIEISNHHLDILTDKLPRVLSLAREKEASLTLRQREDLRQLQLLHNQLTKKKFNNKQIRT